MPPFVVMLLSDKGEKGDSDVDGEVRHGISSNSVSGSDLSPLSFRWVSKSTAIEVAADSKFVSKD